MLCETYKTIFVHVPKAAGQSIEQLFLKKLGLTWADRSVIFMRNNTDPMRGPFRLEHMFASEYVSFGHVSQAVFDAYFKFAVVRNPWARIVSAYKFTVERRGVLWRDISFRDFISRRFPSQVSPMEASIVVRHLEPQWKFVCDAAGNVIVDRVLRFERIADDFAGLSARIFGVEERMPVSNVSNSRIDYRNYYDDALAGYVADLYANDIALFGYEFDDGRS
jgi:hypothetical protein